LERTNEWLHGSINVGLLFVNENGFFDSRGWDVLMKDILCDIDRDFKARKPHATVIEDAVILPILNNMPLRFFQFQYYIKVLGLSFIIKPLLYEKMLWDEPMSRQILYEDGGDYIMFEDPYLFQEGFGEEYGFSRMLHHIETNRDEFNAHYELFRTTDTPRDTKLVIYRKRSGEGG
jgi:hypothetical protein